MGTPRLGAQAATLQKRVDVVGAPMSSAIGGSPQAAPDFASRANPEPPDDLTPVRMGRASEPRIVSDFANYMSLNVCYRRGEQQRNGAEYNFRHTDDPGEQAPGMSAFALADGVVYHTYSTYARGVEQLMGTYRFLDLAPLGRNEKSPAAWWRRHDEYGNE